MSSPPPPDAPTAGSPYPSRHAFFSKALPVLTSLAAVFILAHLKDFETVCRRYAEAPSPLTAPPRALWMAVTLASAAGLVTAFSQKLGHRALLAAAASLAVAVVALLPAELMAVGFLAPVAVFAMAVRDVMKGKAVRWDLIAGTFLVLILSYGAFHRYLFLVNLLPAQLDPDVEGYITIAQQESGWKTKFREPLFIWILQLFSFAGGTLSPVFIRLTGVALSLASIAVIFEFCRRTIGCTAAVVAGLLYAGVPFMAYIAARGLREDLAIATTFLFIGSCLHVWNRQPAIASYCVLGLAGAAAVLVRLNSLNFVMALMVITFAWIVWKQRPTARRSILFALPIAITLLLTLPYLLYLKQTYGDPFFTVNWAFRFYANVELVGKHPDIPSAEEIARDGYAGPPISAREYLFKYHSIPQLVSGMATGTWRLLLGDYMRVAFGTPRTGGLLAMAYLAHLAGLASMFLPGRRFTLFALAWFHLPMLYIASLRDFDPRLLSAAYVGYYVAVGSAAAALVSFWRRSTNAEGIAEALVSGKRNGVAGAGRRRVRRARSA